MIGSKLGPYEIVALLGAGGMGEVWRARDTRLGRDIALKVLPEGLAADAERLRRFELEARAAAALNHPNILAVYDVGREGAVSFLVSELLEGESVRARLARGPLTIRQALDVVLQIARGLAAAHAQGIVHRDLKPENLFLLEDGRVKILDFGLARLVAPEANAGALGEATTVAERTESGMVLGTAGYMSPEQVRAERADARSDLFSLGSVLYELISGKRAFRRETQAETMTAILREEPADLATVAPETPPALLEIVRACLEKRAERRFQSAHDLVLALQAIVSQPGASAIVPAPSLAPERRGWSPRLALAILAALVVVGLALWAGERIGVRRGAAAIVRPPPSFQQLTYKRGYLGAARFAPDGKTVVYSAAWGGGPMEPYLTRLDTVESRPLGIPGANLFSASSQGEVALALEWQQIFARQGQGTLARAPLVGGAPREILRKVRLADWDPEGKKLAAVVSHPWEGDAVEFPIGTEIYPAGGEVYSLRVSPRGDRLALLHNQDEGGVSLVVLEPAGKATTLSRGWHGALGLAWARGGEEIWFTAAKSGFAFALYAVDLTGRERLIAHFPGRMVLQDVGADGKVLLAQEIVRREMVGLPPGSTEERDLSWLDYSWPLDLSDDGGTLLFSEASAGEGANGGLYLRATDGSPAVRLGRSAGRAALSPDGKWVLAAVTSPQGLRFELLPTGAGETRLLEIPGLELSNDVVGWSPDGQRILFSAQEAERKERVFSMKLLDSKPTALTPEGWMFRSLSSDGQRLLAIDREQRFALFPASGGEPSFLPEPRGDDFVRLGGDGRSLYLMTIGFFSGRIERWNLASGRHELLREVHPADSAGVMNVYPMLITPDGASYVYTYLRTLSTLFVAEGLE